jgi:hypothetical protein
VGCPEQFEICMEGAGQGKGVEKDKCREKNCAEKNQKSKE